MKRISRVLAVPVFVLAAQTSPPGEGVEFFESRIRPVLAQNCYACHSRDAKAAQGGLVLDSRDALRRGGQSGAAIVPGKPDESLLIQAVRHSGKLRMPPMGKLPEAAIADLTRWVAMGAPDPRENKAAPVYAEMDLKKGREFWAFQAPQSPRVPAVKNGKWTRGAIDRFVLARLERQRLVPVADADRATLLRRVTFDLTGLPPTPAEIEAFLKDRSKDAYARVVDRLLRSDRFGERWGRHWLDVARYAESMGRTRNYSFPFAWRYRDYVIRSFSQDKPFDRFVTEQIAGDLTAGRTDEQVIATAFLALGAHDLNEQDRRQAFMDVVDEQINATTRAFLGLTVGCARCHDHKFDPIPTRDYYALAGIFASTEIANGLRQRPPINQAHFTTTRLLTLADLPGEAEAAAARRADLWSKLTAAETARKPVPLRRPEVNRLVRELSELGLPQNLAMGVRESARTVECEVNLRGDPHALGDKVPRGYVRVLFAEDAALPEIGRGESGRLQLAAWLTRRDNPLTARVMANRIWQHMFGRGIVETPDNFGNSGARPSHPELLDYLAVQFMDQGWSVKKLIREIALSRTYQLSSAHDAKNYAKEPDNVLLWRANRRRLEAEAVRDSLLAVSGRLTVEAPQASPILESDTWIEMGRGRRGQRLEPWEKTATYRSVYVPVVRNFIPRFFEAFDFPEPSETRGRRDVTTVAPQALFLMNDPFVMGQARAAASALLRRDLKDAEKVALAYRQTLSREPRPAEVDRALTYVAQEMERASADNAVTDPVDGWARFYQALFASAEFRYRY